MTDFCRNLAADVAQGILSKEELDDLMDTLRAERKRLQAAGGLESVEAGVIAKGRVIAEESALASMIERRNRLQNILVEAQLKDSIARADLAVGNPALGLQAALVGIHAPIDGAQRSVDSLTQGIFNGYMGGMIADLERADLRVQFNNMKGDFEAEVADALSDLNRAEPTGKVSASPEAKAIAKIMNKYQRGAMERENRAGAYIRNKSGYIVRQSHQPGKLARAGLVAWKDAIRDKLDFGAMEIAPERVEAFLDSAFDAIKSGIRVSQNINDLDRAFTGPGNLAAKVSASRVLEFKSARDWLSYDKAFGVGSLREAFYQDISRAAKSTAMMTNFGTNPQAMLDRVIRQMREKYRGDTAKLKGFSGDGWIANLQNQYDEVSGDINIGADTTVARVGMTYRALQTMSKLGGVVFTALTDIAYMASNRIYQGRSMMDAWGDGLSATMSGLSGGQKREFADMMGAGLEGQLGDFMSRFNASDSVPGRTSKLMSLYFKMNFLAAWTDASKRGITMMVSRDLAMNAALSFDALPPDMARMLRLYGFDARQWEVARKAVRKADDGRTYLMPGDVANVRGGPFTGLSAAQQDKLRDQVKDNLFAMMSQEADFAVPTPGARERAILRQGYRPGTPAGEAIRFVGQFKSFGVTGVTKVLGRQMYGSGSRTVREQWGKGIGANLGIINAIVGTTVIGYMVMQSKELMKGRELRPNTLATFFAAALQGGGLGIYGDFLFGESNRYGSGPLEVLAGPAIGTAMDVLDLLQRARGVVAGGEEDLRGDALRLAKSNIPFANLFYIKGAMDYLIWYQLQEAMNPGYLRRMERRVARENNQKYWAPPSAIIAPGGGFR